MNEKHPFIVVPTSASAATSLPEFLDEIAKHFTDCVTVRRVVGEAQSPKRLVIDATEDAVRQLKERFAQKLNIEPDLPLKIS